MKYENVRDHMTSSDVIQIFAYVLCIDIVYIFHASHTVGFHWFNQYLV